MPAHLPICKSWIRWKQVNLIWQHLHGAQQALSAPAFMTAWMWISWREIPPCELTRSSSLCLPSKLSRLLACFPSSMLKHRGWVMQTTLTYHIRAVLRSQFWAIWAVLNWGNLITWDYFREQQMLSFPFQTTFHIYKSPGILGSLKGLTSVLPFSKSSLHITCHVKQPERECKHKPYCYLCFSTKKS